MASEKRTVTGTAAPEKIPALLRVLASADGVKLPSTTTPLAWFERLPGWSPKILVMAAMVCSAVEASCAEAAGTAASSRAAPRSVRRIGERVMIGHPFAGPIRPGAT